MKRALLWTRQKLMDRRNRPARRWQSWGIVAALWEASGTCRALPASTAAACQGATLTCASHMRVASVVTVLNTRHTV